MPGAETPSAPACVAGRDLGKAADVGLSCKACVLLFGLLAALFVPPAPAQPPALIGLDHIPLAVRDLDRARATFGSLGFALKPGRGHANGIQNAHLKFPDGAGIELITASGVTDDLTAHYVSLLRAGEGPAFFSLHARDTAKLHAALRDSGYAFRFAGGITTLHAPELAYLLLIRDNRSPTDRPEHFAHANGATSLRAVWVATEHGDALVRLLVRLGGQLQRRTVLAPQPVDAAVVALAAGEVIIIPASHQLQVGRPVVGASFRVSDLAKVRRLLSGTNVGARDAGGMQERVLVDAKTAHGIWLEFRSGP